MTLQIRLRPLTPKSLPEGHHIVQILASSQEVNANDFL